MKYTNIIADMTWSHSRIKSYEDCPYGFFLRYILRMKPVTKQFFSSYGSLMHSIIEQYLLGMLEKDELTAFYLSRFKKTVGRPPSPAVFKSYFEQGYDYLDTIEFPHKEVLAVERNVEFQLDGVPFVGIIDYEAVDSDGLKILGDNKSRALKERSARKKPTKTDLELDEYFKQLYLYSFPFQRDRGAPPDKLEFNCFRTKKVISEPFDSHKQADAKEWALRSVDTIAQTEDWSPKVEFWKCKYLCDQNQNCEYCKMIRR